MTVSGREVKNIIRNRLLSIPAVSGIYFDDSKKRVVITVDNYDAVEEVKQALPDNIAGYDVEFEVMKTPELTARVEEYRPLVGGISIGHYRTSAGTYACLCYDRLTSRPMLLSNAHVFTPVLIDGTFGNVGDIICQPGVTDSGGEINKVGELVKWVKPTNGQMYVDAALAKPMVDVSNQILGEENNYWQVAGVKKAEIGMVVKKSGRTTGVTYGKIDAIGIDTKARGWDGSTLWYMLDQIRADIHIEGGDSGSLLLTEDNYAVGLIWGGESGSALVTPIGFVMDALDIWFASPDEVPPERIPEGESTDVCGTDWYYTGIAVAAGAVVAMIPLLERIKL